MSFSNDSTGNGMVMPVTPMNGYGNYAGGFGWGDGSFWIIVLFLFALMGNWGNGNGFGSGNGTVNINNDLQRGFDQQSVMSGISGMNSAVINGFAGVNQALCNGFAGIEASANARQMADMQQSFASQMATNSSLNAISASLANCCCENRAAVADLKYTVANEVRNLSEQNDANTQRILDQLCQDKIDEKNEKIAELQQQLTLANLAASQNAQTASILNDNLAQTNALEQYLAPIPRPAYVVQNPACCNTGFNTCNCAG